MWLFLRIIERRFFVVTRDLLDKQNNKSDKDKIAKPLDEGECLAEFLALNKKYTVEDAVRAHMMALKAGYIGSNDILLDTIRVNGKLFTITSVFGLIKELARELAPVSSLVAVLISLCALGVSIRLE